MITIELTKPVESKGVLSTLVDKVWPRRVSRHEYHTSEATPCSKVNFIKESELGKEKFPVGTYVTYANTDIADKIPMTLIIVVDHEEVYSQARFSAQNGMPRTVGGRFMNQTTMVPYTAVDNPVYHWAGDLRLLSKEEKEHVDARVKQIQQQASQHLQQ